MHSNRWIGSSPYITAASPRSSDGSANRDYLDLFLPLMQPSRRYETVAAVISLAAENYDACRSSVIREHVICHGPRPHSPSA